MKEGRTIGVADTTFARVDLAKEVLAEFKRHPFPVQVERITVPGMKDLPVACKRLLERRGCDIVVALAWVGKEPIDEQCAHEANIGLQYAQVMANRHILSVFFHETETTDPQEQKRLAVNRAREHAQNALWMLFAPEELAKRAGTGQRQGGEDAGPIP